MNATTPRPPVPPQLGLAGLRGRFLLLVVGICCLVGAVSALGVLGLFDRLVVRLGTGYAVQYARQQQARISAKLEREIVLAQKLVESPLLKAWASDEENAQLRRQALNELDSYRRLFSDQSYFFIIDSSKHYYFNNASDEFRGRELRYQVHRNDPRSSWYFETLEHVDDFVLHVDNSPQLEETKVWINAVVKDGDKKLGLGGSGLDLTRFLKEVLETPDHGVEMVIVDRAGFVQAHSDATLIERNVKIKDGTKRLTIFELIDPLRRDLLKDQLANLSQGPKIAQFQLEDRGRRLIVGAAYLQSIDWIALVFVEPSQVVEAQQFLPLLAVVVLALLASVGLVSYAIDRLLLRRLTLLTSSVQEIASGDYHADLTVDSSDEIGQLTESFNHMTATIRDHTHNLEDKVATRTDELRQSNLLLEQSNKLVMDSIHYALLIQTALLAKPEEMQAVFSECFTVWLPRDVVGGDFYTLYSEPDGSFLLAVADCTGHGVPGAFMSMASKALLDRAVATHGLGDPALLLQELHHTLQDLLRQEEPGSHNGLDIALVSGRRGSPHLRYAGARIPLWLHRPGHGVEVLKADKCSLGYAKSVGKLQLSNREVELAADSRVYLTTDGLLDQPGGAKGFGLGQRRLQEAFTQWESSNLDLMSAYLESMISDHAAAHPQRDDITVVGFRLPIL